MITEGIGKHAPKPVPVLLSEHDLRVVTNAALSHSKYRGYLNSTSQWKRGLIKEITIPKIGKLTGDPVPRFVGLAGEAATVLHLNDRANLRLSLRDELLAGGDDGKDLEIDGLSIQIKTRQKQSSAARERLNLIRHTNEQRMPCLPNACAIVFCELDETYRKVSLIGWTYTEWLRTLPAVPARVGRHLNVEVEDKDLKHIGALVDRLVARRSYECR